MSKKDQAETIYAELVKSGQDPKVNKDVYLKRFIDDAQLTTAGATTYLRNCQKTYNEETATFGKLSASSSKSTTHHTSVVSPTAFASKANSGDNTDDRQIYSLVFRDENDGVASMQSQFDLDTLRTLQKQSKTECIIIKGIGKDDVDEIVYSKLKQI